MVGSIALLSTLAYPAALLLPQLHKRFYALLQLSMLLAIGMLLVMLLTTFLFKQSLLRLFSAEAIGNWIYMVPVSVFICNMTLAMNTWYLRTKDFGKRAGIDVGTSLAGRVLTLGAGVVLHGSPMGLLLGDLFSRVIGAGAMLFSGIHRQVGKYGAHFPGCASGQWHMSTGSTRFL